jgi:hypothetical protein
MQLVSGRFERKAQRRIGQQVERDLVRRARRGPGDRAGEAPIDRTMQVAAKDALDLRMARDNFGEGAGIIEPVFVHVGDAGGERRVMHHHDGGPVGRCGERAIEPSQPIGAQFAVVLPRDQRVERNQPQRIFLDRILDKTVAPQVSVGA